MDRLEFYQIFLLRIYIYSHIRAHTYTYMPNVDTEDEHVKVVVNADILNSILNAHRMWLALQTKRITWFYPLKSERVLRMLQTIDASD